MAGVKLNDLPPAALAAAMKGGTDEWGTWGSAEHHVRYAQTLPEKTRRHCFCGCKTRLTHMGMANGVALISGCEMVVTRWVRETRSDKRAPEGWK